MRKRIVGALAIGVCLSACGGPREDRPAVKPGEGAPDAPAAGSAAAAGPADTTGAAVAALPGGGDRLFTEVAEETGLRFTHNTGAFGQKWLPETMGSGCAWFDYDNDGDPDALLLSGKDFAGHPTGRRQTPALFRNDGGRFADVTESARMDLPTYAIGATCGDYDSDGDTDVYLTALGPNRLLRNDGGRFTDVAAAAGVADAGFGSAATWIDYDRDADLDLFTLNYVTWTPETDIFCSLDGTNKSYCTPEAYPGTSAVLYRNDGGRFADVTEAAGLLDTSGKGLGVVALDFDADGWLDLFVANDTQPNFLWRNRGDGTFEDQAMIAGVAFDESGRARGAMGVDIADYDGSGRPSLAIGNFSNEMLALYHNEGSGFFIDAAPTSAVGRQSLLTLQFGVVFFDYDLDGLQDIFVANGHVENDIQSVQARVSYEQTPHLFRNKGGDAFEDVAPACAALKTPLVARGAAVADFDADGDVDILVNTNGGRARLYRNDAAQGSSGIRIRVVGGAGSPPDAFGAKVVVAAGGKRQTAWVRGGHSYASQSESILTFGLGAAPRADEVVVTFPSGRVARVAGAPAGASLVVREETAAVPAG